MRVYQYRSMGAMRAHPLGMRASTGSLAMHRLFHKVCLNQSSLQLPITGATFFL